MSYPLLNFNTETFEFKLYTNTPEEQQMLDEFKCDEKTKDFLPDFLKYIEETQSDLAESLEPLRYTTIAYFENRPIGMITFFDIGDEYVFSHGIRPSERGNRFSSRVKREVFDYVFRTLDNVKKITVFIDVNNENNLNSLKKLTYDEIERVYDPKENREFYKVSNCNPYLEKGNKLK